MAKMIASAFNIEYDDKVAGKACGVTEYINRCMRDIGKTDYFQRRGLTEDTIKRFCLGYDEYRHSVVIPYNSKLKYYQSRSTEDKKFYKPKTEEAGQEPIFNNERINGKSNDPLYVVESPICCMTIEQCGYNAISTCGTAGWRKVAESIAKSRYKGGVVLCFDNDEAGKAASTSMTTALHESNIKYIAFNVSGQCKDPNELYLVDRTALKANLKKAKVALRKKYATERDSFTCRELMSMQIEPTDWIIKDMLPTGLAFLCAKSKYRKSWMALQMCLAIAEGRSFLEHQTIQYDTLYYALEDTKARLADRTAKMLKGKEPSDKVHFVLKADCIEKGLTEKITEELENYPNIKLVIIDTLQKVRGSMSRDDTLYGNEYKEMSKIKDYADKHKICIMFVHHLRKMSDENDIFNTMSGSTALMGAADTIFVISKKKRTDEDATLSMTGRDVEQKELVINFNNTEYMWEVEGTPEEMQSKRERAEYESCVYVRTIKELVKRNPITGWTGTASDLLKAVYDITGKQVADSSSGVGKIISKYDYRLHCDGIEHKMTRGTERKHTFTKYYAQPIGYQGTIYD